MTHSTKRRRLELTVKPRQDRGAGTLYVFGTNISGQFGFVAEKRKFPALVPEIQDLEEPIQEVAAGGMHTVVLTKSGEVYTFGCNDDGALGRPTPEEEENFEPGKVDLPDKIEQISAGDSHTAALSKEGVVYAWGTFRDGNGAIGLIPGDHGLQKTPLKIVLPHTLKVVKIASGDHHVLMLTDSGVMYNFGVAEVGQLGRRFRALRSMKLEEKEYFLTPGEVRTGFRKSFVDIWVGGNVNYCKTEGNGEIWVFGLNSNRQLALSDDSKTINTPHKSDILSKTNWTQFAAGAFHCLGLDSKGKVYSWGRADDGRLGLGPDVKDDVHTPTLIPALADETCVQVACGSSVSYALTKEGLLYSWGFGENWQLGNGSEDDLRTPGLVSVSIKKEVAKGVVYASSGGQHTCLIASKPFVGAK